MGEYLREIERRAKAFTDVDPGGAWPSGLVILFGVLAVGLGVAAGVRTSIVAAAAAVLMAVAGWLWWLSDRAPYHPQSRSARLFRERPEVRLALLSMVCFFVAFFGGLAGLIRDW